MRVIALKAMSPPRRAVAFLPTVIHRSTELPLYLSLLLLAALVCPAWAEDDPGPRGKLCDTIWCKVPDGQRTPPPRHLLWKTEYDAPQDVWSPDGQRIWLVGLGGQILYSPDRGGTWESQESGTAARLNTVHGTPDGRHVWAAGETLLRQNTNSSVWHDLTSTVNRPDYFIDLFAAKGGSRLWAWASSGKPRSNSLWFSDDGGSTWQILHESVNGFSAVENSQGVHVWLTKEGSIGYSLEPTVPNDILWEKDYSGYRGYRTTLAPSPDGRSALAFNSHNSNALFVEIDPDSEELRLSRPRSRRPRLNSPYFIDALLISADFIWITSDSFEIPSREPLDVSFSSIQGLIVKAHKLARFPDDSSVFALSPGGDLSICTKGQRCEVIRYSSGDLRSLLPSPAGSSPPLALSKNLDILELDDRGTWRPVLEAPAHTVALHASPDGQRQFALVRGAALYMREVTESTWKPICDFSPGHEWGVPLGSFLFASDDTGERLWLGTRVNQTAHLWFRESGKQGCEDIGLPDTAKVVVDLRAAPDGSGAWASFEPSQLQHWTKTSGWQLAIGTSSQRWHRQHPFACLKRVSSLDFPLRTCLDSTGRSWELNFQDKIDRDARGQVNHRLVLIRKWREIWAGNFRSVDGGRTWNQHSPPVPWNRRSDWTGVRNDQVWLLTRTGTTKAIPGSPYPQIDSFRLNQFSINGRLKTRLLIRLSQTARSLAPDEVNIGLVGISAAQLENGDDYRPIEIAVLGRPDRTTDIWSLEIDPRAKPLFLKPGDTVHFEITLKTKFSDDVFQQAFTLPPTVYDPWHRLRQNAVWLVPGLILMLVLGILTGLLYIRPLTLLRLHRWLRFYGLVEQLKLPVAGPALRLFLELSLLPAFIRHRRTLDAWVEHHSIRLNERFEASYRPLVKHSYVPLPVRVGESESGHIIDRPNSSTLAPLCRENRLLLQILGPGGAGKTSLAMQIGRWASAGELFDHPVAPVLIDEDTSDLRSVLLRKLRIWLDHSLEAHFLDALVRKKRILVLVDRVSERNPSTRNHLAKIHAQLPANALVCTARFAIEFESQGAAFLFPQPLDSSTLLYFIASQLQDLEARHVFPTLDDQLNIAKLLGEVVRLGRNELPLRPHVVTLYIREAVRCIRETGSLEELPTSVPEVYFRYLRDVNPGGDVPNRLEDDEMLRAAEVMAQLALTDQFVPSQFFLKSQAHARLAVEGWERLQENDPIQRLVDNGVLIERTLGTDTMLSFSLDPLAELLAAMAIAKNCGGSEKRWVALLKQLDEAGAIAEGFANALQLVHASYSEKYGWPTVATNVKNH